MTVTDKYVFIIVVVVLDVHLISIQSIRQISGIFNFMVH